MGLVQKPFRGARLNRRHPLAPDVLACIFASGANGAYDHVRQAGTLISTSTGTGPGWIGDKLGQSLAIQNVKDFCEFGAAGFLPVAECSVVLAMRKRDATNRASFAFAINTIDSVGPAGKRFDASVPFSDGVVYWDFGGTTAGTSRLSVSGLSFGDDVWVFTVGPRGMEIWQNGFLRANQAGHATRTAETVLGFRVGSASNVGNDSDLVNYKALYIYGHQLPSEQVRAITYDLYAPFYTPLQQRYPHYFVGAAVSSTQSALVNMPLSL